MMLRVSTVLLAAALILTSSLGCDDDSETGNTTTGDGGSGGAGAGASGGGGAGGNQGGGGAGGTLCHDTLAPADAPRSVVVAHPYNSGSGPGNDYQLLELTTDGTLTGGGRFSMGRAPTGKIAFTPDGAIGLLAQDDGSLGVFRIDDGAVTVVHATFVGSFYAGGVVVAPSGDYAWVLDPNWVNNGGGIYRVAIACDGSLTDEGLVIESKLSRAMLPLETGFLLASDELAGSPPGADVHRIELLPTPKLNASADAFPYDDAIVASLAITHDGLFGLIGDNSGFALDANRVSVMSLGGGGLTAVQQITPLEDPAAIVTSPFDDRAIVTSGFGDAIFELSYDSASATSPFALVGEVAYQGGDPQLPVDAVGVERGGFAGLVLVSEVTAVRRLRFVQGQPVNDLGLLDFGAGSENIVGAIGVQP